METLVTLFFIFTTVDSYQARAGGCSFVERSLSEHLEFHQITQQMKHNDSLPSNHSQ